MTINVAVIGAGLMGRDHALRLSTQIVDARVSTIADLDESRAAETADGIAALGRPRPVVTTDPFSAISNAETDAVVIASHDSAHADLVLAAIERRVPVLCEKPLAPTVEECARIVAAEDTAIAEGSQRLVSVGFMRRFDPGCGELRRAVESNELGPALMAHCIHRNADPYPGGSDHTITGSAIHEFDFLPWLFGSPIVEMAWLSGRSSSRTTRQDPQLLMVRMENGVLITLEMFVSATYGYEVGCEVVFERGTVSLRDRSPVETRSNLSRSHDFGKDALLPYADAYRGEVQAWVDSLGGKTANGTALANARDGLRATRAAQTMVRAMENGDGRFLPVAG